MGKQKEDHPCGPALLDFQNITVGYNGRAALEDVTFQVEQGAQVAVVGPNGAGKSTLFKAMVGLLPLRSGQILVHCVPLGGHKDCIAYVPQREEIDRRFPVTVQDVVTMGRFGHAGWIGRLSRQDLSIVRQSMSQLGILDLAQRSIADLSGGQLQRVFLARALAQQPHILLMDEPFTGVDITTQEVTLDLLKELQREGVTVLVSTHDLTMASERFEKIVLLNRRLVAYGSPAEALSPQSLNAAFGRQIFATPDGLLVDQCCPHDDEEHHHHHPEENHA